jgi:ABC-2 type transport system ATP-binding protein
MLLSRASGAGALVPGPYIWRQMPDREAIVCRALTKHYGGRTAVAGIDFAVHEGEIFGLLGPNGAGKTTILKIILGLVHPSSGEVFTFGSKAPCPEVLRETGAMVEKPSFYPWLTGRQNLQVFLESGPPGGPDAIDKALAAAGLTEAAGRRSKTYSQGMAQRLGMAIALLRKPRLLVLDEPTNGLDPAGIRDFRQLIQELSADGVTVLLSSHLLSEVERLCHRVAFLSHGRIRQLREVDSTAAASRLRVKVAPVQEATAVAVLQEFQPTIEAPGILLLRGPTGEQVGAALATQGIYASTIENVGVSLEEIYLEATADTAAG